MNERRAISAAILIFSLAIMLFGGWWLGSKFGELRAAGSREEKRPGLQSYLESNIRGIEIGKQFPDIPVWQVASGEAHRLSEVLPDGGIVFYVSSRCESCADAVEAFHQAIQQADSLRKPVIVVTSSEPEELAKVLTERGVDLPLYCDMQDLLLSEYRVVTTRTYFDLLDGGIVARMGTAGFDPGEYLAILASE